MWVRIINDSDICHTQESATHLVLPPVPGLHDKAGILQPKSMPVSVLAGKKRGRLHIQHLSFLPGFIWFSTGAARESSWLQK